MGPLKFDILHRAADCGARVGQVTTPHGAFDTPAFMAVGTRGTIRGLLPDMVRQLGCQIILANTYHLLLRPGSEQVAAMGGLHRWMRWSGPILTDSGGYQVFSLADINTINDHGVTFRSHVDGALVELTPSRSIQVQNQLGADIIMAFDDCPPSRPEPLDNQVEAPRTETRLSHQAHAQRLAQATERSVRWLEQCLAAHQRPQDQALFGIIQGGTDLAQRDWCLQRVCQHDLPGYAIGGVAVGEGYEGLKAVVEHVAPRMPAERPRYLMGVGYERDLLTAVRSGVDLFDCVLPTRNGRNANAFTPTGQIRLRNAQYAQDPRPIDEACDCPACAGGFSRGYLRHLFNMEEMLGPILVSAHNLRHFQRYLLDIRRAIVDNAWSLLRERWPVSRGGNV